jgi:hypothetical protein
MSRIPHVLDNWIKYGGKVVSLTLQPPFIPKERSWDPFLLDVESTPGLEGLGKLKKYNDLIWNWTRDIPAYIIVPQPTTVQRAPF